MSDSAGLERRYRRLLACYPRAFRREHEQEMLSVLMAGAEAGRRWPLPGEAANLIRTAIWMRLNPRTLRWQPAMRWAIRLIYLCAALRLIGVPILPATTRGGVGLTVGVSWAVIGVLAWANGRGFRWARALFGAWVAFHSLALLVDIAHVTATTSAWSVIASLGFWLIELSALVLLFTRRSGTYFRRTPAQL